MSVVIYHNPRCSKSRATLALLEEKGIQPQVIEYLTNPPTAADLTAILQKLGMAAKDLVRKKEAKEEGVDLEQPEAALIQAMVAHPRVIERPVVVTEQAARVGRPPESVLEIV